MSKAINFITISTEINPDDSTDMARLGTFLLALARTSLSERGVGGVAGRIVPHGRDYKVVFDGGAVLARPSADGSMLFRAGSCPIEECGTKTWSTTGRQEFCPKHWNEMHGEENISFGAA